MGSNPMRSQLAGPRHDARVGREDSGNIREDLGATGPEMDGQRDRRRVAASPSQRRDLLLPRDPLETGHDDDASLLQLLPDPEGPHRQDARVGVVGVGHDPALGAGEGDGRAAQRLQRHGQKGHGDPLPGRQEHVQLAPDGAAADPPGQTDQLVRGLPHGRDDHDDRVPGLPVGQDPPRHGQNVVRRLH